MVKNNDGQHCGCPSFILADIVINVLNQIGNGVRWYTACMPGNSCVGVAVELHAGHRKCGKGEGYEGNGNVFNLETAGFDLFAVDGSNGGDQGTADKSAAAHHQGYKKPNHKLSQPVGDLAVYVQLGDNGGEQRLAFDKIPNLCAYIVDLANGVGIHKNRGDQIAKEKFSGSLSIAADVHGDDHFCRAGCKTLGNCGSKLSSGGFGAGVGGHNDGFVLAVFLRQPIFGIALGKQRDFCFLTELTGCIFFADDVHIRQVEAVLRIIITLEDVEKVVNKLQTASAIHSAVEEIKAQIPKILLLVMQNVQINGVAPVVQPGYGAGIHILRVHGDLDTSGGVFCFVPAVFAVFQVDAAVRFQCLPEGIVKLIQVGLPIQLEEVVECHIAAAGIQIDEKGFQSGWLANKFRHPESPALSKVIIFILTE